MNTPIPPAIGPLIASRICHDLANPLGAVGNGVELLGMTLGESPEMALVNSALAGARARLDFLRIAFGAAAPEQTVAPGEIARIIAGVNADARHQIDWAIHDHSRPALRRAFLAAICVQQALPLGGTITLTPGLVHGTGRRVTLDPTLWGMLSGGDAPPDLDGARVQFALLAQDFQTQNITAQMSSDETQISLRY